jgi:phosphoglycerate dehydrogenase-like enzyme
MIRVGYPATISSEFLGVFPPEAELIPIADTEGPELALDVWIPEPFPKRASLVWQRLSGVKLVLSLMAGTEWILPLVGPHVTICSGRGAHSISTAEWTLAAILASLKNIVPLQAEPREEVWKRRFHSDGRYARISGDQRPLYPPVMVEELTGKRVLLIGHGSIGQQIEQMLAPFYVELTRVALHARTTPLVHAVNELDALLPEAEIVILILPLTAASHHLIGRVQLARMRQGALLVNAARGAIIDTDALIEALNAGRIRAALDVTDPEPLPEGHPLWRCPNTLITPHVAGSTPQFAPRALKVAADELIRYMRGEPLHNMVQAAV